MKDPSKIKSYIEILNKQMNIRKIPTVNNFTKKAVELFEGTPFERTATDLKNMTDNVINQYEGMTINWKKALIGSTMTVFLDYLISKFKNVIEKINNARGTISDSVLSTLGKKFQGDLLASFKSSLGDVFSKSSAYLIGIGEWAEWISKIVGGIDYVAKSLYGTTDKFSGAEKGAGEGSVDVSPAQ